MNRYEQIQTQLIQSPRTWLITGVAGFIGSHLLENLLKLNQRVVGLDNFTTGYKNNLEEVQSLVSPGEWKNFEFIEGDINKLKDCRKACKNVSYVLHQAALGSVPRSIANPIKTNATNVTGFLNMLVAAREENVKSFTYASSSSTYGDHKLLPKIEETIGKPLSTYALTKYVNELYAGVFALNYNFNTIGLRYFNVFGPRQDPNGAYAAVIPKWIHAMINGKPVYINGDGETSRDFCYVANVVQANILAATTENIKSLNQIYNIAVGERTSLNELYNLILKSLNTSQISRNNKSKFNHSAIYKDFRDGDVIHSHANISKAKALLYYKPNHKIKNSLMETIDWYQSK